MTTPRNQSVFKAFAMLRSFKRPDECLTSSELSRRAKLPEASGYRLIQTLEELGAVRRAANGGYRPGMLLLTLSHNVVIGDLLREASQEVIGRTARELDVTMHIGVLEGGMVTYLSRFSTATSIDSHTQPGAQLEAYCSGLGKILLAGLPDEQIESFLMDGELIALTGNTITDPAMLRTHLRQVRGAGFALDDREIRSDMWCLAVPVRDTSGRTIAAISASEYVERQAPERIAELKTALQQAAGAITAKIFPDAPSWRRRGELKLAEGVTTRGGEGRGLVTAMNAGELLQ